MNKYLAECRRLLRQRQPEHRDGAADQPGHRPPLLRADEEAVPGPPELLHARERRPRPRRGQGAGVVPLRWRSSRGGSARATSTRRRSRTPTRQHELVLELAPHLLTISVARLRGARRDVSGSTSTYEGNHDEVVAEALGVGPAFEGLVEVSRARVHQLRAVDHAGPRRVVPAPGPALDRDPDQRLPGPHRRVRRRPDQRLFHDPPVLGQRPRPLVPRRRSGARAAIGEEIVRNQVVPRIVRPAGPGDRRRDR